MYCPSCESLMPDNSKFCGRCGMFLSDKSERLEKLRSDFAWIFRRSWGGFVSGFVGWILVFIISRMLKQDVGSLMNNTVTGLICGVFLGTAGGIIEESAYKAFCGGILGAIGGALGGLLNIPLMGIFSQSEALFPFSIMITWAIGGAFIGATSGIIERSGKKILAGVIFGFAGGAIGGYLGSVFYGSALIEFQPRSWMANRFAEGLSGGLLGASLWFVVGIIEKVYIFKRKEDPSLDIKECGFCSKKNPLKFWYCSDCGKSLPTAAPRQKVAVIPYHGIERVINAFRFLSWLFGVAGAITTPVIFVIFLFQDIFLAFIGIVFSVLFTYLMMLIFRFAADMLACFAKSSYPKAENAAQPQAGRQ